MLHIILISSFPYERMYYRGVAYQSLIRRAYGNCYIHYKFIASFLWWTNEQTPLRCDRTLIVVTFAIHLILASTFSRRLV